MSFSSRVPANHCNFFWDFAEENVRFSSSSGWFGLRQDACRWLLHLCPIFETYANIQYNFTQSDPPSLTNSLHQIELVDHQRVSRRYFFQKKRSSSSFCDPMKSDGQENEFLMHVVLPPIHLLKLHEPDWEKNLVNSNSIKSLISVFSSFRWDGHVSIHSIM